MNETATDPVAAEIEALRQQIGAAQRRIAHLRRFRSHPIVVPVLHYWRHHSEYREEADTFESDARSALEQAYRQLAFQADMGECAPEGVIVGGFEHSMDDLRERFGEVD